MKRNEFWKLSANEREVMGAAARHFARAIEDDQILHF
jgi:hypothetical protein